MQLTPIPSKSPSIFKPYFSVTHRTISHYLQCPLCFIAYAMRCEFPFLNVQSPTLSVVLVSNPVVS